MSVHPRGLCESDQVGSGTTVSAFAHVMHGAVVGRNCAICESTFVEGGARLGDRVVVKNGVLVWDGVTIDDDVFVGPAVVFTNSLRPRAWDDVREAAPVPTRIQCGATIGANTTIVCGTIIGEYALIAAGATLVDNVPAHALMMGSPAHRVGWVCTCGKRLDDALRCACGLAYRQLSEDYGLQGL